METDMDRGMTAAYGTILAGAFTGQEYISPAGLYNDMWFPGETFVHVLENYYEDMFRDDATRAIAALRTMCDWGLAKALVGTSDHCVAGCVGEMLDHHDNVIYSGMTGYVPYGSTSITGALFVATPWLYGFGRGFDATWVAWLNTNWDAIVTTAASTSNTAYDPVTGLWGQSTDADHQATLFSDGGNDRHWFDAGGNIGYTIWMGFVHRLMAELAWRASKSQAVIDAYADVWFRACRAVSAQMVTIPNPHLYEYVREEWSQQPTAVQTFASSTTITIFSDTNSSGASVVKWTGSAWGTVAPLEGGGIRLWTNNHFDAGDGYKGNVGLYRTWDHDDFKKAYGRVILDITPESATDWFQFQVFGSASNYSGVRLWLANNGGIYTDPRSTFAVPLSTSVFAATTGTYVANERMTIECRLDWTAKTYDVYKNGVSIATGVAFAANSSIYDKGFEIDLFKTSGTVGDSGTGVTIHSVVWADPIETYRTPEPMMALPYNLGRVGNTIGATLAPKALFLGMLQPSQERAVCAYIRHMALQPDKSGRGAGELFGFPSGVGAGNTWRGYVRTTPKSREHHHGFSCVSRTYGGSLNRFNYGGNADGGYWRAQHGSFIWCIAQIDQTLATQVASRLEDDVQTENTATGNTYAPWEQRLIYAAGASWQGRNYLQATLTAMLATTPTGKV